MSKHFWIFLFVGILAVGGAVYWVLSSTKGAHLELHGKVLKVRTGSLDDNVSAAVVDFRVENPSDVPFVIRTVDVTLEKAGGGTVPGSMIARSDLKAVLAYNKFLGGQYNDVLSLQDKIPPHSTIDRMVAIRFEEPLRSLEHAAGLKLHMQDIYGTEWVTEHKF